MITICYCRSYCIRLFYSILILTGFLICWKCNLTSLRFCSRFISCKRNRRHRYYSIRCNDTSSCFNLLCSKAKCLSLSDLSIVGLSNPSLCCLDPRCRKCWHCHSHRHGTSSNNCEHFFEHFVHAHNDSSLVDKILFVFI